MDPKNAILKFRESNQVCRNSENASAPFWNDQAGNLLEARFLALSMLLEIEPRLLCEWLDLLVWRADLAPDTLKAARNEAGIPIPPLCDLNIDVHSDFRTTMMTLTRRLNLQPFAVLGPQ